MLNCYSNGRSKTGVLERETITPEEEATTTKAERKKIKDALWKEKNK